MEEEKNSVNPKKKGKGGKIAIIILAIILAVVIGGIGMGLWTYLWQDSNCDNKTSHYENLQSRLKDRVNSLKDQVDEISSEKEILQEQLDEVEEEKTEEDADKAAASDECKFEKEGVELTESTNNYGIFGDDTFDTVVCGYAELEEVTVFEEDQTNVDFNIVKFADEKFKDSLQTGIDEGNSVNSKEGDTYKLGLGCNKDGGIEGVEYDESVEYMDEATQKAILDSTPDNPVALILSFGEHQGHGCQCCSLAHQVKIY